jgi:hypothetical protein
MIQGIVGKPILPFGLRVLTMREGLAKMRERCGSFNSVITLSGLMERYNSDVRSGRVDQWIDQTLQAVAVVGTRGVRYADSTG